MESITIVRTAVLEACRLARQVEAEARAESSRITVKAHQADRSREAAVDAAAEARAMRKVIASVLWVPLVRGQVLGRLEEKTAALQRSVDKAAEDGKSLRRRAEEADHTAERAAKTVDRLVKAGRAINELGTPSKDVIVAARSALSRIEFASRVKRKRDWLKNALSAAEAGVAVVRDWAKARAAAEARRKAPRAGAPAKAGAPSGPGGQRVYLPIPPSLGGTAERLGARRDHNVQDGVSPWYVTFDMNLTPFRDMLPLAHRPQAPKFEFPPVPYRAAGQNLWGVFDRKNWDLIRRSAYSTTGRRCAICGNRGGFISEKVLPEGERHQGVECHEVWEWKVEDPASGVGIQRLKRLLVVCSSCHAMFHSGYFQRRAREVGLEDQVKDFIEKRRMLVNRVGRDALATQIEASRDALMRMQGVDQWIMDLGYLASQQFMVDRTPTLLSDNEANIPPERIANLSFRTDRGESFEARSAQEIYEELLDSSYAAEYGQLQIVQGAVR